MSKKAPHIPYHNDVTADFVGALSNIIRFSFSYFLAQFGKGEMHYFDDCDGVCWSTCVTYIRQYIISAPER